MKRLSRMLAGWLCLLSGGLPAQQTPAQQTPAQQAADPHVADSQPTAGTARQAIRRAVTFFDRQVSAEGGYLWRYSSDLAAREGEGRAGATTAWVQPPGTPSVGDALLEAYQLTGDELLLQAALAAGEALRRGQLESGGWDYRIEFSPQARKKYAYRTDGPDRGARNTTTLDDNTTQSALRFLMRLDYELKFDNEAIHQCVLYAQQKLLAAQYPNGAWPQRFDAAPDPAKFPVRRATLPRQWPRRHPALDYKSYYTFNDNTLADMISTMFLAEQLYDDASFRKAALKAGQFILLAQLPEPQPGWAQQYNAEMQPAWARKFEPPAVTGGESQGVMRTLMDLYEATGEPRFLEPLPRALRYYKRSTRPDGRLARFYELSTNKPLYFTKDYQLTYSDADMPTHYGFVVGSKLDSLERRFRQLQQRRPTPKPPYRRPEPPAPSKALARRAQSVIAAMDDRGAWVEQGDLRAHGSSDVAVIETRTFISNLRTLAQFVGSQ